MAKLTSASMQVDNEIYRRAGVPEALLGKHHTFWTLTQLREILGLHRRVLPARAKGLKLELMRKLDQLIQERGVNRSDCFDILPNVRRSGENSNWCPRRC